MKKLRFDLFDVKIVNYYDMYKFYKKKIYWNKIDNFPINLKY